MDHRRININDFTTLGNEASRRVNELIVLNLIREKQPISRADLARATGLKESTISSIVKSLTKEDLIYESALGDSSGGRRPRMLRLNSQSSVAIGIDLGFLETVLGVGNLDGEILFKKSIKTEREADRFLPRLADEIECLIRGHVPSGARLEGIGISLPGITDRTTGEVIYAAYMDWRNVPVGEVLRRRFKLDFAFDDNQNTSGLAELWFSNLSGLVHNHIITVLVNAGVGTAIIVEGHLYRGASLGAGQFGHVTLDPEGPQCCCGNQGCWELYASDLATLARYRRRLGQSSDKNSEELTVSDLAYRAKEGEEAARWVIQETGRYLGMGVAMLVNGLNPEMIIVNGQICEAWELIEPEIWQVLRSKCLELSLSTLQLRPSSLKENPCLMGAISLVLCRRFGLPKVA